VAAHDVGALELAVEDNRNGIPTRAVIVFETGGVRLQEANLGLAAIAEIHAGIRALRPALHDAVMRELGF
jgi:malonate decarboxylase beta subunit